MNGLPDWTPDRLEELVRSGTPVLADLRAEWCPQCGPQEAVIVRLLPELGERVAVGSVDVGLHPEVTERYDVRTLPSLLLFHDGALVRTLTGFSRAPVIRGALAGMLSDV